MESKSSFQGNSEATADVSEFIAQNGALPFTQENQTTTYVWEPNSDVHTAARQHMILIV